MERRTVAVPKPTGECFCGCGGRPRGGGYFLPGHDQALARRVIGRWYRATGDGAARSGAETVAFAVAHDRNLDGRQYDS